MGGFVLFPGSNPQLLTRKLGGGQLFRGMMQNLPTLKPTFLQKNLVIFTPPMRQWPQSNTGDTAATEGVGQGGQHGAAEMAPQTKVLATMPDDLSSIPQMDTVEGGNQLLQAVL